MQKDMIIMKNMLLIGSSGRNSGKTTLAKAIIQKWKKDYPVFALKIISIDVENEQCHRGEDGCGVCTGFQGRFELTEEHEQDSEKDTAQLLAAGARKSFLLKTLRIHLAEAITACSKYFPPEAVIVCESNSLRQVVTPGVFLFVQNSSLEGMKPSARAVYHLADTIVSLESVDAIKSIAVTKNEEGMPQVGIHTS